jgi:serine/threonine protein phosphatase PrpC
MRGIGSLAAGIFRKPEADVAPDPGLSIIGFLDRESSPARVVVTRESAASYHKFTGSEDVILNCPTEDGGVFGVYDGLGGTEGDSSEAGRIISDVMQRELSRPISEQHWEGLRVALWLAQRTARRAAAERGFGEQINTVGTTARLFDYGSDKICLGVIHVGDTTLFRIRDSKMMKLTPNQALEDRPNVVTNTYAPRREFDEEDSISVVPMRRGDRIILCSDGITGDWPDQKMTQDEIAAIARAETPEETADLLMLYGIRKDDDRAVLVFDV